MPDMGYMKTECNSTKDPTYKKSPRTGGSIVVSGIVLIEIFNAENLMQFFFLFFFFAEVNLVLHYQLYSFIGQLT